MSALVLSVDDPVPPTSGARLRVLHLARHVSRAIDGVVVGSPGAERDECGEEFGRRATGSHRGRLAALVASARSPYQASKLNTAGVARLVRGSLWSTVQAPIFLLPSALGAGPAVPVIVDAYDIESETARSMAAAEPSAVRAARWRWEAAKIEAFEHRFVPQAAAACATSDGDAERLERLGARDVTLVPNGVDTSVIEHVLPAATKRIVFVGSYDYRPNVDAATELARDVLPRLRRLEPHAELSLVGRNAEAVNDLAGDGVVVTGFVDDVLPHLREARALVVPLRAGSGTRLKVLEAMAAGTPVVATSFAVAGLPVEDRRHAMIAEGVDDLVAAAYEVLTDDGLSFRLSYEARRLVETRYDWGIVAAPLIELHARLGAGR